MSTSFTARHNRSVKTPRSYTIPALSPVAWEVATIAIGSFASCDVPIVLISRSPILNFADVETVSTETFHRDLQSVRVPALARTRHPQRFTHIAAPPT